MPQSAGVVVGDVSSIDEMKDVARQVNILGTMDAVIHNVGIGSREPRRLATHDGLPHVFAINTLAPYVLTAMITPPKRLVFVSSGQHRRGDPSLVDLRHGSGHHASGCPGPGGVQRVDVDELAAQDGASSTSVAAWPVWRMVAG